MKTFFILIISSFVLCAQESYTLITLSPFYTYGKYTNQISSSSTAIYGSVNFNGELIFSSGYDKISLKGNQWSYDQSSIYLSTIKKLSSFYFKLAGVYIKGNFNDAISEFFNYKDENLSLTTEVIYNFNWNYLGLAYNYVNSSKGFQILKASNIILRYDTFLDYYTYLSIRPNIYLENSGKKFLSLSTKLSYWFNASLVGNLNLTLGNRRYYFDNDLLTFYNQYYVQKIVGGVGLEYSVLDELTLSGGYLHTKFENFNINYFFLGLRTKFNL